MFFFFQYFYFFFIFYFNSVQPTRALYLFIAFCFESQPSASPLSVEFYFKFINLLFTFYFIVYNIRIIVDCFYLKKILFLNNFTMTTTKMANYNDRTDIVSDLLPLRYVNTCILSLIISFLWVIIIKLRIDDNIR